MTKFLNKLIGYVEISNFERGGLLALLFCVLSVSGYYYYKNNVVSEIDPTILDQDKLLSFQLHLDSLNEARAKPRAAYKRKSFAGDDAGNLELSIFHPMKDGIKELKAKGVPPRVAHTLMNFREKGGSFVYKEDLKKLYVVDEAIYSSLEPFIDLPHKPLTARDTTYYKKKEKKETAPQARLALNTATKEELEALPGIGDYYSRQITEYRDKLGGFTSIEQLYEVYKMREETVLLLKESVVLSDKEVTKIDVNKASFKVLVAHPYLSYNQVKAIVSYREQHGEIKSIEEFENLHIFRGKDISRLLPYLDLN